VKTAVVTGASRGIGAAIARGLARDGYRVVINYKNSRDAAEALARELGGVAFRADVSREDEAAALLEAGGAELDALVCNAGIALTGVFQDTAARWRDVFETNVGGAIHCVRAAIAPMLRKKRGSIVLVSSVWGVRGASCEAVYASSKAAVLGLARSLALELAPSGIRVNCVAPGVIDTDMLAEHSEETRASLRADTPLGRLGTPEDVAAAVRFLCSDAAGFVTGQTLGVDGGF
jgi:3-oxoacyl-[acyl-carrier protein] reductase